MDLVTTENIKDTETKGEDNVKLRQITTGNHRNRSRQHAGAIEVIFLNVYFEFMKQERAYSRHQSL